MAFACESLGNTAKESSSVYREREREEGVAVQGEGNQGLIYGGRKMAMEGDNYSL